MQIFDTHCHYNLEPLVDTWQDHWHQAQKKEVIASLIPGTSLELSQKAINIASQESNLFAAVALHPHQASQNWKNDWSKLTLLAQKIEVVAIGETGLDYYSLPKQKREQAIDQQKQLFKKHLALAQKLDLPVIIHARDKKNSTQVYQDILTILESDYYHNSKKTKPIILHCVSGPKKYIQSALTRGAYISVAGNVTYPNAQDLRQIVRITPTDKLLVETDAPFLPPQTHRGQINQPWMVAQTVKFLENELGIDSKQLLINAQQAFKTKK